MFTLFDIVVYNMLLVLSCVLNYVIEYTARLDRYVPVYPMHLHVLFNM